MEMTIELADQDYQYCLDYASGKTNTLALNNVNRIIKAVANGTRENRLKADMVVMLENLDLQIDESAAYNLEVAKVQRLIRDKINVLKENTDDN